MVYRILNFIDGLSIKRVCETWCTNYVLMELCYFEVDGVVILK